MIGKGLGYTSTNITYRYMTWCAIGIAIFKLFITKYDRKTFLTVVVLNIIGIFVWTFSGTTTVLLFSVTISAMKNINLKSVYRFTFWILAFLFVIRTSLSILGFTDIQVRYFFSTASDYRLRYGLGYGHPNSAHFMLFIIFNLCILVYSNRLKLVHYFLMFIYNLFIYSYTNSRAGMLVTSAFIVICIISRNKTIKSALFKFFSNWSNKFFILTSIISVVIVQAFWKVDILRAWGTFSSRFSSAANVMDNYHITLFGIQGVVTDLGMINFLYSDGLIFFVIFVLGYYLLLKKNNSIYNYYFMLSCLCYAIYCLAEAYADSILMNITLLSFAYFS